MPVLTSSQSEPENVDNNSDLKNKTAGLEHETASVQHKMKTDENTGGDANTKGWNFLPPWLKKKRYIGLISAFLLAVVIVFAVLGGLGIFNKKKPNKEPSEGDDGVPKDGLSPPWYPTPLGGTVSDWEDSYEKAQIMVEKMTIIEKVNVTTGVGWQMGLCVGNTGPATSVGFPSLCLQDGPLGLRLADNVTAFPAGVTVGSTWNRDLMHKRGQALGKEARLKGVNVILGPAMGPLGTSPAGGRNWEGFGSDPVLQGVAAAETIRGIQENGVIATAKHYVLNEQEHFRQPFEWGIKNAMSSNIDDRTLREVYIWPFAESVRAGVASIMCAYQMVNNSYACGNSLLMNGILKDELGFQGFVQSDWYAQQGGVSTALSGLDMTMPGQGPRAADTTSLWGANLTLAALNDTLPMERLNDMATRIVATWYQLGQDKWPKHPTNGKNWPNFSSWTKEKKGYLHHGSDDDDTKVVVNQFIDAQGKGKDAHGLLAREIASEGTILLKNKDNILPLSRNGIHRNENTTVGVFGEDAGPGKGPNSCPDRSCNQGTLASGWGSGAVDFPYLISPWKELKEAFDNKSVSTSGYLTNKIKDSDVEDKDLCIVFANADAGEGFASDGDLHGDRNDLFLQNKGDKLIHQVADWCGNGTGSTVVVLHAAGPVILEKWIDMAGVKGIVLANLPGQESGRALVDVLFGTVDVSGRLPYTIGKSEDDYGSESKVLYTSDDPVPQKNYSHGLYLDYRYFDKYNITPRYEFGYGLSYTTFNLSNLTITPLQEKSSLPSARKSSSISPPSYNDTVSDPESALFPEEFKALSKYIYPYISSTKQVKDGKYPYPDGYDQKQTPSPAGGGEGGNPSLFKPVANVSLTIKNTGDRTGKEVIQLYVSFPSNVTETQADEKNEDDNDDKTNNIDFPTRVLRNFQKIELEAGKTDEVTMSLTRKDLSYWSTRDQNWVMPVKGQFKIWAGRSSRDLPLVGEF